MQSRMNKYDDDNKSLTRSSKNTDLYKLVYEDIYKDTTYNNMEIIDSAKEINVGKLKNILDDKYDTRQYRTFKNSLSIEEENDNKDFNNKSYDINEIINNAKNKRTFIEEAKEKQKFIEFTEKRRNDNNSFSNEEKLQELIGGNYLENEEEANSALDLLSDLKGNENTIVTVPIKNKLDEIVEEKKNNENSFYTNSNEFTENDFEDFNTLSRDINKKSKTKKIILIILIIILILVAIAYYLIKKGILKI